MLGKGQGGGVVSEGVAECWVVGGRGCEEGCNLVVCVLDCGENFEVVGKVGKSQATG